jgi:siroheme synthase (precorrin-2 oxidase/ferrochelatase)
MSGTSDGGNWVPPSDNCATLTQHTTLNSPDKAVLASVKKGDELVIAIKTVGNAIVVQALHKGKVAGSITSSIIQKLAECVEQGYEYVAEVTEEVRGGVCKVRVHVK